MLVAASPGQRRIPWTQNSQLRTGSRERRGSRDQGHHPGLRLHGERQISLGFGLHQELSVNELPIACRVILCEHTNFSNVFISKECFPHLRKLLLLPPSPLLSIIIRIRQLKIVAAFTTQATVCYIFIQLVNALLVVCTLFVSIVEDLY